jgi:hypothetical protein
MALTVNVQDEVLDAALRPLLKRIRNSRLMRYDSGLSLYSSASHMIFVDDRLKIQNSLIMVHSSYHCGAVKVSYEGGEKTFIVSSPLIENEKYRTHDERYHTKKTKSEDKAFDLVCKFIKPLRWDKLFACYYRAAYGKHNDWTAEAITEYTRAVQDAMGNLSGSLNISPEVFEALVTERSYVGNFANAYLNKITDGKIVDAHNERKDRQDDNRKFLKSVYVHPSEGYYVVAGNAGKYNYEALQEPMFYLPDQVPENIRTGVALMRMTEPLYLTPRIGYRAADDIYYLYENIR